LRGLWYGVLPGSGVYSPKYAVSGVAHAWSKKSQKQGLQSRLTKISISNLFGRCGSGGRLLFEWRAAATAQN
jgi:hypothetical protein